MSPISTTFNGTTIFLPGAYSKTTVDLNSGNPVASAGVVGIVGEAAGGAPGSTDGVQSFSINEIGSIVAKYQSGQIVDAVRGLSQPGSDPDVPAGASVVRIYKTNASTQATAVARNDDDATTTTLFNLTSKNYGLAENQVNFYISEGSVPDVQPNLTSADIALPLTLTEAETLIVSANGVAYTFTVPAGGAGPHATLTPILALLNDAGNWSPSKPIIATNVSTSTADLIKLTIDTSLGAFNAANERHEYTFIEVTGGTGTDEDLAFRTSIAFATDGTSGGVFTANSVTGLAVGQVARVIDNNSAAVRVRITAISGTGPYTVTTDTNLAAFTTAQTARIYTGGSQWSNEDLIVTAGTAGINRGSRGTRIFNIKKSDETETTTENANNVMFRLWYIGAGTAATMTIQDNAGVFKLTTSCTGASGDNLDITLSDFTTLQQLVDFIDNFSGGDAYICATDFFNSGTVGTSVLDYYNAIDIKTLPIDVKAVINELLTTLNAESQFMTAARVSNVYGQLDTISSTARVFLTGGVRGASTNARFQSGFDAMLTERCNIVVPLVSRDASVELGTGATDPTSTYTIESIIAMTDAHDRTASNTQNRSERNSYVGFKGTLAESITQVKTLSSEYTSLAIQDIRVLDATGTAKWFDPWMFAVLAAGMQAGSDIGMPLTRKKMNAIGVRHSEFNPKTQFNTALMNGILYAQQPDTGGVRIVAGNTTYLKDSNPVFNRISIFEIVNYVAYDSRQQLEAAFVGQTRASGTSLGVAVSTFIKGVMNSYRRSGWLVGDTANGGLGYRNLTVTISGGTINWRVVITPAPGIDFILGDLIVAQVNETVSQ